MTHIYQSPYGPLLLQATGGKLCRCSWALTAPATAAPAGSPADMAVMAQAVTATPRDMDILAQAVTATPRDMDILAQAVTELDEYFRGTRRTFSLPLRPHGTPFRLKVWRQLLAIPYGTTISYKRLAALVDCPQGQRAVAMACSRNPISIIVPCHRVISSTGHPGGYTLLATPAATQVNSTTATLLATPASHHGSTPAGIDIKTRLLAHERLHAPRDF